MSTSHVESSGSNKISETEYRDRLRELPPSAKLVAKVLETTESLSKSQLAKESMLPDRTLRSALDGLEESEIIEPVRSSNGDSELFYCININKY